MSTDLDRVIEKVLAMKTIAVVGLSKDQVKPSHDVAMFMQSHGYRIVPINPTIEEVLDEKSYPSLLKLPDELKREIDVVDIFRRTEDVPPIVTEAVLLHRNAGRPKAVWMQLGIVNEEAANAAAESGMDVVMDRCMKMELNRRLNH